jgi:hypothetical protein
LSPIEVGQLLAGGGDGWWRCPAPSRGWRGALVSGSASPYRRR